MGANEGQSAACPACGREIGVRPGEFLTQCPRCRRSLRAQWQGGAVKLALSEFESPADTLPAGKPAGDSSLPLVLAVLCLAAGAGYHYRDQLPLDRLQQALGTPPVASAPAPAAAVAPAAPVRTALAGAPAAVAPAATSSAPLPVCIGVLAGAKPVPLAYFREADGVKLRGMGDVTGAWKVMMFANNGVYVVPAEGRGQQPQLVPAPTLPDLIYTGIVQMGKKSLASFAHVSNMVGVGEQVLGAKVLAISAAAVKVEFGGARVDIPRAIDRPDLASTTPRFPAARMPVFRQQPVYTQTIQMPEQPVAPTQAPAAEPDPWAEAAAKNRAKAASGPHFNCRHCNEEVADETFICPHCKHIARNF